MSARRTTALALVGAVLVACPRPAAAGGPDAAAQGDRAARPPADEQLRVADDLADLGVADEALEAYRDVLRSAPTPDEAKRALYGAARSALLSGERARAEEWWEEIARRFPDEAPRVLFARLDDAWARWAWDECAQVLDALEALPSLSAEDRRRAAAARAAVDDQRSLVPALEARFADPPGAEWYVTDPTRVRWDRSAREVRLRLGAAEGGLAASPFASPALAAAVAWGGEPCALSAEWKVLDMDPGGVARLGLLGAVPAPRGPAAGGAPADRIVLELSARADDAAVGDGAGPRRYAISLVAVSGGARAERASSPLQSSFALDVWYAVRIEYAPAPPRLRVEVEERAEGPLAAAGAEGRARTVFSARLPLSRPLADGRYVLGAVAPEDEPDGAPATLVLRDLRFRTTRAAIARGAPLPGDGTAGDFFRATAAAATGRPAEAMLAFRRAAAGDPLLDAASFGEGLAAREAGDLAAAVRAFAGCMRTVSRAREELRRVLAEIETHGSREDLLAALEAYLAVEPDDSWARAAAENARRRLAEALDQEALALPDPGPARRVQRGRLYLRAALPAKALAEADAAVAASLGAAGPHPGDASAFLLRADALAALGRAPLAAVDYARAHRRDPGAPEPLLGLARLYLALPVPAGGEGSPAAAAEAALSQAEPLARDPAELYVLRARARLAQGKIALARDDAARAARLAPRSAAAHAAVAAVALREGRRDAARAALALAARFGPVDPALLAAARVPD